MGFSVSSSFPQCNSSVDSIEVIVKSSFNPSLIVCCSIITLSCNGFWRTHVISTSPAEALGRVHFTTWFPGYVNSSVNSISASTSWLTVPTILNSPSSDTGPLIDLDWKKSGALSLFSSSE